MRAASTVLVWLPARGNVAARATKARFAEKSRRDAARALTDRPTDEDAAGGRAPADVEDGVNAPEVTLLLDGEAVLLEEPVDVLLP